MKKVRILSIALACGMLTACNGLGTGTFAPDRLFAPHGSENLYVANRAENELIRLNPDFTTTANKATLKSPVNDMDVDANGNIWVVCDGYQGELCQLNPADLSLLSAVKIGNSPSAVTYNSVSNSVWVAGRFKNNLQEVDPATGQILATIDVGREPVDVAPFAGDSLLLVVNNLPEMNSLEYPIASRLAVVDVLGKQVTKRIMLPNGATDAKAVAVSRGGSYAYVTHLLARYQLPTNQVDRGWMSTNALSIIDLEKQELLTTVLVDTPQKGSANPWGVTVSNDNKVIIVAAAGVDELVVIDRNGLHNRIRHAREGRFETPSTRKWEDIPNDASFLYRLARFVNTGGKGARSVVAMNSKAYTANYFTGEIMELNFNTGDTNTFRPAGSALASTTVGRGNMHFHDATLGFQGWQSCATCHPNDARVDGLNWDLLNDGMGNPKNTHTLILSHQTAPAMVTGIRKNAEVAVRSGLKHILFAAANEEVSCEMDEYIKAQLPEPSPYLVDGQLSEAAKRGEVTFRNHCASCHSGPHYTDQQQYNVPWATGKNQGIKMDVPMLKEVWRTGPYLYDGRAATMREMLDIHGPESPMSDEELNDLAEYVLSL